jgi:hypothetical protein
MYTMAGSDYLKKTTSAVIISHLKKIFAAQGIPMTVVSATTGHNFGFRREIMV